MNLNQTLQDAVRLHQAGELAEAEKRYRLILAREPRQPDALHLLGVIAHQLGRHDAAVALIQDAIRQRANVPDFHNNLGQALEKLGHWDRATQSYRTAIQLKRGFPEAHNNLGNALRHAGRNDEAATCYETAIALNPRYGEALNNLGLVLADRGQLSEAIACFERALQARGERAEFHLNLGLARQRAGDRAGAGASYRRALELNPDFTEARNNFAVFLHESGHDAEALAALDRVIAMRPDYPEAHYNRGMVLKELGRHEEAERATRQALALRAAYPDAQNLLGNILKAVGRNEEAIAWYRAALALDGQRADYYNNLGNALCSGQHAAQAIEMFRTAIRLDPNHVEAHSNLGNAYQLVGDMDAARAAYQNAIARKSDFASAHNNLGNVFKDEGRVDEAIASYRRAIELNPNRSAYHNLLFALHYHPAYDAPRLALEHRRWREQCADPLRATLRSHGNQRDPERRLRVGYVSADFRTHAVARFLYPLLQQHRPDQVEIFCYSNVTQPDPKTAQFRAVAHAWHSIVGRPDAEVAELIRQHAIDVLVDLGAHTSETRVLLFARKPAPVQVTWLAYPGSTGLDTIDYRFSDPVIDPPGGDESVYAEKTFRLAETYWCCEPPEAPVPVGELPVSQRGAIAFGCLNNFCKIADPIKETWARILGAVPGSTLIVHSHAGSHRERFLEFFAARGIARERIEFAGKQTLADYLATYNRFDIALDPSPFVGGTTTCDALWMGVPVVTLRGDTAVSRGGASLLSNVGLPHLIAHSHEEYARIACALAADVTQLGELRRSLRARIVASPVMDAPRFARNIEAAYRALWRRWCVTGKD